VRKFAGVAVKPEGTDYRVSKVKKYFFSSTELTKHGTLTQHMSTQKNVSSTYLIWEERERIQRFIAAHI
jgi:hypothetical protein